MTIKRKPKNCQKLSLLNNKDNLINSCDNALINGRGLGTRNLGTAEPFEHDRLSSSATDDLKFAVFLRLVASIPR